MKTIKAVWKTAIIFVIGAALIIAFSTGSSQPKAESIAQVIERESLSKTLVTVDGQQYAIVTLRSYIAPETLECSPTSKEVKVYVDTEGNPVSDRDIAQKIGLIDSARRFSKVVGSADEISQTLKIMDDRLHYHEIIRFGELFLELSAKAMASAVRGYITAGASVPHDIISAAKDTAVSLLSDPSNVLEAIVYLDFSNAEKKYQQAIEIVQKGEITDYDVAHDYLRHFLKGDAYQYPAFNLLDKIDDIEASITDELVEFSKEVADEIAGGQYGRLESVLDALKDISGVKEYLKERDFYFSRNEEFLSSLRYTARYTLALAEAVPETPAESQPPGVQLVLEGISRISWMFETPEEEWVNTKSMGEIGHEGDDFYADDWARKDGNTRGQIAYAGIVGRAIVLPFDADGYGNHVVIYDSASKFALRYAHLDEILVSDGQDVTAELTPIGKVGSTGLSTGPHLHVVLYKNVKDANSRPIAWAHVPIGKPIDPPTEFAAPFLYNPKIEREKLVSPPAQITPGIVFERTYGGANDDGSDLGLGPSVQQTSDGGYIIAGYTESFGAVEGDAFLIKTDADGNILWKRIYRGASLDEGFSSQQTSDGGYIIAGTTLFIYAGWFDVYLIKTDADGFKLWERTYGGKGNDVGYSVQQTSDGGYIIAGYTISFGADKVDVYLIKTNANGVKLWERTYGGKGKSMGFSVQQTSDGGYIIAGVTQFPAVGSKGDVYLIKTDADGFKLWERIYGGKGDDVGYSVQQTSDGGYIIAGTTKSFGAGESDVYLIKTDANGVVIWERTYGGAGWDEGYSVQQTSDGGYIIAGETESFGAGEYDVYLIKMDADGVAIWERTYGGAAWDYGFSVQQTSDGGYIIAGVTESFGAGGSDVYLIKTDEEGETYPEWDANQDGRVDIFDLVIIGQNFGGTGKGDVNGDGKVDIFDLVLVGRHFGE